MRDKPCSTLDRVVCVTLVLRLGHPSLGGHTPPPQPDGAPIRRLSIDSIKAKLVLVPRKGLE